MALIAPFVPERLEAGTAAEYGRSSEVGSGMSTSRIAVAGYGRVRAPSPQPGFTLIELMVTLAVVGILVVVAVPAMVFMINSNRLAGTTGELTSSLQLARSEAVRRGASVTICGSTNGTDCNSTDWSNWIVTGADSTTGDVEVIRDVSATGSVQLSGPATGIVFRPSGLIDAQQQLVVCVPTTQPQENRRVITVMISGNIITDRAGDGGGDCP